MKFTSRGPQLLNSYRLGAGLVALATATTLVPARPVWAQDNARADEETSAYGEIVVTGRYTIEERIDIATGLGLTLPETPQSVTVITAQRILDQNLDTVADVVVNSVGVSVNEVDGVPLAWTLVGGAAETVAARAFVQNAVDELAFLSRTGDENARRSRPRTFGIT